MCRGNGMSRSCHNRGNLGGSPGRYQVYLVTGIDGMHQLFCDMLD
jgi:hypothetical protein